MGRPTEERKKRCQRSEMKENKKRRNYEMKRKASKRKLNIIEML